MRERFGSARRRSAIIARTVHQRSGETGNLPSPLPQIARQRDFAAGRLGLWGPDHFVIYYRNGRFPQPGL
jgi:hypothetical protein